MQDSVRALRLPTRPAYLSRLLDLSVGQSVKIVPDYDDTSAGLLKRLKRQATRYRHSHDRYFRFERYAEYVLAIRVSKGNHHKLSPYLEMELGELKYFADELDEAGLRRLKARLIYMLDKKRIGFFAEQCSDGKIYLRCEFKNGITWGQKLKEAGERAPPIKLVCSPFGFKSGEHLLMDMGSFWQRRFGLEHAPHPPPGV